MVGEGEGVSKPVLHVEGNTDKGLNEEGVEVAVQVGGGRKEKGLQIGRVGELPGLQDLTQLRPHLRLRWQKDAC